MLHLDDANLEGADLSGAIEDMWPLEQLGMVTLDGVTMPNAQKYEDWLKEKDNRKPPDR